VKLLLYLFEQMSGFKINFEKSELLLVGDDNDLVITRLLIVTLEFFLLNI
jgi:hypothetical protein